MLRHDGREVPLAGGPACRASLGEWPLRASSSIVQQLVRLGATELELARFLTARQELHAGQACADADSSAMRDEARDARIGEVTTGPSARYDGLWSHTPTCASTTDSDSRERLFAAKHTRSKPRHLCFRATRDCAVPHVRFRFVLHTRKRISWRRGVDEKSATESKTKKLSKLQAASRRRHDSFWNPNWDYGRDSRRVSRSGSTMVRSTRAIYGSSEHYQSSKSDTIRPRYD